MTPPRIKLDPSSPVPAIRQIADGLRVLLVEGQLAPGAALPSVRRLAMELGVHFNTVAEAYRLLASEGWLELNHGKTAVVMPRSEPPAPDPCWADEFRERLRGLAAQLRSRGIPAEQIAAELRALAEVISR